MKANKTSLSPEKPNNPNIQFIQQDFILDALNQNSYNKKSLKIIILCPLNSIKIVFMMIPKPIISSKIFILAILRQDSARLLI